LEKIYPFLKPGVLTNEISLYQFFKKDRWGEITSTPTTVESRDALEVKDYG
jgi:hypothetical protein